MQSVLKQFEEKGTALLSGQFSRARIELTLIYAIILLTILGISSIITYSLFSNRLDIRWAEYHRLPRPTEITEIDFPNEARAELALSLFIVNGVLFIGGIGLSYILAGITLQPIQRAYNRQRQFLSDASHELRTPLAILQTDLENELSEKAIEEAQKERAESHLEEVKRMASIVRDLLLISRLEPESQHSIALEDVSLVSVAQSAIDRLQPYAAKQHISLISKLSPKREIHIQAHHEHILQAISNLIKNGIDYNTEHGSVTIAVEEKNNNAIIIVADTGVGIPQEDLQKIFDRFYRSDASRTRTTGGSGLGLSIVQSIAKSYNGSIELKNNKEKGITVYLSFPIKIS
ncbi:MAG TPA: HAMP domain-containing sensor histidine kinase [Candidatus Andersenbacteria bacterium]|nr:HAMP domain-containing sensor histidine kinase [Candidatus Andersenbacteria bacterium]